MAERKNDMVYFVYEANDHGLRFSLKAEIEASGNGVYTVMNIRQDHEKDGSLLPPFRLCKRDGLWIIEETEIASRLCAAIGAELDKRQE
ncbi:MAG TPA: hypothetical protein VGR89_05610 [Puia sp.]|nr:hypothetical protein [Puia sp.]